MFTDVSDITCPHYYSHLINFEMKAKSYFGKDYEHIHFFLYVTKH